MGVANTVYHPADYSILSAAIDGKKIGKAFSIHTFAGYLGFGVTPAMVLACAAIWDWHGAFLFAAGLSFAAALLLIVAGSVLPRACASHRGHRAYKAEAKVGLDLLLSPPILRNLLFFFCLAMANGGIQTFTVVGWARSTARRPRSPTWRCRASCCSAPAACCWAASSPTARRIMRGWRRWALPAPRPWRS